MNALPDASRVPRTARSAGTAALLVVLATACTHPTANTAPAHDGISSAPGQVSINVPDVSLSITGATAHLDATGSGTLTMTVHNDGNVPEHLDMVGTPNGGRGVLTGKSGATASGSMTSAGILLEPGSTVTFAGAGPSIRLTDVHGVTDTHTLPLVLEFGVARLVHLSAVVPAR